MAFSGKFSQSAFQVRREVTGIIFGNVIESLTWGQPLQSKIAFSSFLAEPNGVIAPEDSGHKDTAPVWPMDAVKNVNELKFFSPDKNKNNCFVFIFLHRISTIGTSSWVSMFRYKSSATKVTCILSKFWTRHARILLISDPWVSGWRLFAGPG